MRPELGRDALELVRHLVDTHVGTLKWFEIAVYDLTPPSTERTAAVPQSQLSKELLRHEPPRLETIETQRVVERLRELDCGEARTPAMGVGLSSRCWTRAEQLLHFPMMDFTVPVGDDGLAHSRDMAEALLGNRSGALVRSGDSYHLYGLEPITDFEWREFMARALLLCPATDARYIAHRLLDGLCILRLVEAPPAKPERPRIEEWLG